VTTVDEGSAAGDAPVTTVAVPSRLAAGKAVTEGVKRWQTHFPVLQVGVLVILYTYGALTLPGMATWQSGRIMLTVAALAGIAGIGQTILILMGGFDLSISGFVFASGLLVTEVKTEWNIPFVVALLIALVVLISLGAIAGQICHRLSINPLIVTLAMGTIAFGLAESQTSEGVGYGAGAPAWLIKLCSPLTNTFGVPIPPLVVIWLVVAVVLTVFLRRSVPGRHLLATGANSRAAEFALIPTRRVWTLAFMFSAFVSCMLGLAVTGFGGAIVTTSGDSYMFQSVVVVIVGGTVFGGPGDYLWTVVGALILTVLTTVLVGHGATSGVQEMVFAALILIVLSLYGRQNRVRDRV
jgi:ribose transport system permease protein